MRKRHDKVKQAKKMGRMKKYKEEEVRGGERERKRSSGKCPSWKYSQNI